MYRYLSKLHAWALSKIATDVVTQGGHRKRMVNYYQTLIDAAREEFTEDNKPTLDSFLSECHREALEIEPHHKEDR